MSTTKLFNSVAMKRPRTNVFNLSHEVKLSCKMANLIPVLCQEVVPGDRFRIQTESLVRFSPLLSPVMHRINVYFHYFFVPNRLIWDNWKKFITGGEDGLQTATHPYISLNPGVQTYMNKGSLYDYFGLPIPEGTITDAANITALPFRAYQMIYNEYFRDQNLEQPVYFGTQDDANADATTLMTIRKRAWEKDYFTSALPWTQRGGEVTLPADITYKNPSFALTSVGTGAEGTLTANTPNGQLTASVSSGPVSIDNIEDLGITINDLRKSVRLQEWLEKNARAGSRYIEQILSHFGVKSSDARLQRPEFLGGSKQPVSISEVLSSFDSVDVPGGKMYGHGISVNRNTGIRKFFEEHGYLMCIMSVIPRTSYSQGIDRMWTKNDKFDYYWPEFANLGEQEIHTQEIFKSFTGTPPPSTVFGYQSRYAEYKWKKSTIHGDFRDTLEYWHMGRKFASLPSLNSSFVIADPTDRIFAVTDEAEDKMYLQIYHDVRAIRPMPKFGTPTL